MRDMELRPPHATDDSPTEVTLVRNSDGATRVSRPTHKPHYTWADEFWWTSTTRTSRN